MVKITNTYGPQISCRQREKGGKGVKIDSLLHILAKGVPPQTRSYYTALLWRKPRPQVVHASDFNKYDFMFIYCSYMFNYCSYMFITLRHLEDVFIQTSK